MVNLPVSLGQYCFALVSILAFMSSSIKLFGQAFTAITVHKETTSTLFNLIGAATCDFQQCGILTNVDSYEPCSLLLSLETPNDVWSVA